MSDGITRGWRPHRGILLALVALCVAGAGCAGLGLGGNPKSSPSAAPAESPAPSMAGGTDGGTVDRGTTMAEDGHDHTHGSPTEMGGSASEHPGSSTAGSSTAGRIAVAKQHAHGPMNVVVDGQAVNFSRTRFQAADRFFHFEGGDGEIWHAHHTAVAPEYALNSLPDVAANASSFTHDGTTYDAAAANVSVSSRVGGESVEPGEYYPKDGDAVTVVVERSE